MDDSKGLAIAFEEAKLSYAEGGIPVGPHPSPSEEEEDRARAGRKEKKKGSKCADETATAQIGAALISKDGKLLGRGHNQRVQLGSAIHHGETSALYNSGRLPARAYVGSTMYTTLSPCDMCKYLVAVPLLSFPSLLRISSYIYTHPQFYITLLRTTFSPPPPSTTTTSSPSCLLYPKLNSSASS